MWVGKIGMPTRAKTAERRACPPKLRCLGGGPVHCCASDAWLKSQRIQSDALHAASSSSTDYNVAQISQPPTSATPPKSVMLWHGERPDGRLAFLYWPVLGTLIEGFRPAIAARAVDLAVGVGFTAEYERRLKALRAGDTFVWVGINGRFSQPWRRLRARGVRTVYYQTEPAQKHQCYPVVLGRQAASNETLDEIWDFSWHNIEGCARTFGHPRLRFIPPGYLRQPEALREGAFDDSLVFFGSLMWWAERNACFSALRKELGAKLVHVYSAWNESDFSALMGKYDLFVNLHQQCMARERDGGHAPVTFRHAVLLNQRKILLSQRSHAGDEAEYAGMVAFAPLDGLAAAYRALAAASADDRRARAARAHDLFRQKFAPRHLFERAGVYSSWGLAVAVDT